jgi:hypothetical protein
MLRSVTQDGSYRVSVLSKHHKVSRSVNNALFTYAHKKFSVPVADFHENRNHSMNLCGRLLHRIGSKSKERRKCGENMIYATK